MILQCKHHLSQHVLLYSNITIIIIPYIARADSLFFFELTRVWWLAAVALIAQRVERQASAFCNMDPLLFNTSPSSWLMACVSLTKLVFLHCLFTAMLRYLHGSGRGSDGSHVTDSSVFTHPCDMCFPSTNLQPDVSFFWAVAPHECFHRAESVWIKGPDGLGQDKLLASSRIFNQTPLRKAYEKQLLKYCLMQFNDFSQSASMTGLPLQSSFWSRRATSQMVPHHCSWSKSVRQQRGESDKGGDRGGGGGGPTTKATRSELIEKQCDVWVGAPHLHLISDSHFTGQVWRRRRPYRVTAHKEFQLWTTING